MKTFSSHTFSFVCNENSFLGDIFVRWTCIKLSVCTNGIYKRDKRKPKMRQNNISK